MLKIPLTQSKFALIDKEDYLLISLFDWKLQKGRNTFYAKTYVGVLGRVYGIYMHRLLINVRKNEYTDHINRNGLDNRKFNLRLCTLQQNNMNSIPKGGASQFKGVAKYIYSTKKKGVIEKWSAQIMKNYKKIHIGVFTSEIEAAYAYNKKAKEIFGEYARLNYG